jgi:MSHA pilin protein MshC
MVELIVVMVLIAILGAVGAARFFDRKSYDAVAFADRAKAALHFAQKEAIAQHRPVHAYFDGSAIRLCFSTGATCATANRVQAPFSVPTNSVCTSSNWYCIARPSAVTVSLTGELVFDESGRPTDASGNAIPFAITVTVASGSMSVPITIEPETGYVH